MCGFVLDFGERQRTGPCPSWPEAADGLPGWGVNGSCSLQPSEASGGRVGSNRRPMRRPSIDVGG
eukprot:2010919-Rhodomonas_salina.1